MLGATVNFTSGLAGKEKVVHLGGGDGELPIDVDEITYELYPKNGDQCEVL